MNENLKAFLSKKPQNEIIAITQAELTKSNSSISLWYILIGIGIFFATALSQKIGEFLGSQASQALFKNISSEIALTIVIVAYSIYAFYCLYRAQTPKGNTLVLTKNDFYVLGINQDPDVQIRLDEIEEIEQISSNFNTSNWLFKLRNNNMRFDQSTHIQFKSSRLPCFKISKFIEKIRSINSNIKLTKSSSFRRFILNSTYILGLIFPIIVIVFMTTLKTDLRRSVSIHSLKSQLHGEWYWSNKNAGGLYEATLYLNHNKTYKSKAIVTQIDGTQDRYQESGNWDLQIIGNQMILFMNILTSSEVGYIGQEVQFTVLNIDFEKFELENSEFDIPIIYYKVE